MWFGLDPITLMSASPSDNTICCGTKFDILHSAYENGCAKNRNSDRLGRINSSRSYIKDAGLTLQIVNNGVIHQKKASKIKKPRIAALVMIF